MSNKIFFQEVATGAKTGSIPESKVGNQKEYLKNEATAIRNEIEVIPKGLKLYIEEEFNKKIKEACQSEHCTRMCNGEIGVLVGGINNILKSKRRMVLNNISDGLNENGNKMNQENEEAIKKYIDGIIDKIWESEEIVELIMQFFQAVIYWKKQALLRKNEEPSKMDLDIDELKCMLRMLESEARIKINKIGNEEKEKIKERLLGAYKRYKSWQMKENEPKGQSPDTMINDGSEGR